MLEIVLQNFSFIAHTASRELIFQYFIAIWLSWQPIKITGLDSSVGRVSAPGNWRSRVRSRAATYQSRKKMVLAAPRLILRLTG